MSDVKYLDPKHILGVLQDQREIEDYISSQRSIEDNTKLQIIKEDETEYESNFNNTFGRSLGNTLAKSGIFKKDA